MTSIIYGVRRNGKKGIGNITPRSEMIDPKPKIQMVIKPKALYFHFNYGYSHDFSTQKYWVRKTIGRINKKGPKKIWVPKDKIVYVADILSSQVENPIMVNRLKVLTTYNGKKAYVPRSKT